MKIKQFLVIVFTLFLWSGLLAQVRLDDPIDFTIKQASIADALNKLSDDYQLNIAYSSSFFSKNKKVNLNVKNTPISKVLHLILRGTDVEFKVRHQQLILYINRLVRKRTYTVNGYVQAENNNEKLIGVNVYHKASGKWTTTNEYGFYSITLPEGDIELTYSYLGCTELTEKIELANSVRNDVSLKSTFILTEVVVKPFEDTTKVSTTASSGKLMPPNYLALAPSIGGESDILGLAKNLPGVQSGADGFGGLYVRGGDAGQNLMLLDGVPIYNPSHLLGIFSVYNSDAVRSAHLLKGKFPARYGGRVSSVFDVRSKEGNQKEWRSNVGLGLISGQAMVEGPIANKKGAILLAGRRTHSNFLMERVFQNTLLGNTNDYEFGFYDFNAKLHFSISEKDRLYFSYYKGRDDFEGYISDKDFEFFEETEEKVLNWGNEIAAIRWNKIWGARLFSNTTVTYSDYDYQNSYLYQFDDEQNDYNDFYTFEDRRTRIRDWAVKSDFDFVPNPQHYLRFGFKHTSHMFTPYAASLISDEVVFTGPDSLDFIELTDAYEEEIIPAMEWAVYAEDEINLSDAFFMNLGLRASAFNSDDRFFFNLEPRIGLNFDLSDKVHLKAGASKMVQYLQQVSISGINLPDDIWLPSSEETPPLESWMVEAGADIKINKRFNLSVEAYYKKMDNLITVIDNTDGASAIIGDDFEVEGVAVGSGIGYGLELMLQRNGKTGGWLSYTLAKANRSFEDNNEGKTYAFNFDRRQSITAFLYHRINPRWTVSANWNYGSGSPRIDIFNGGTTGSITTPLPYLPGSKNKERNKAYHRLDVNITYQITNKKLQHMFKIGAYNVYNQDNVAFNRLDFDPNSGSIGIEPVTLLYFTPSLYYQIQF